MTQLSAMGSLLITSAKLRTMFLLMKIQRLLVVPYWLAVVASASAYSLAGLAPSMGILAFVTTSRSAASLWLLKKSLSLVFMPREFLRHRIASGVVMGLATVILMSYSSVSKSWKNSLNNNKNKRILLCQQ